MGNEPERVSAAVLVVSFAVPSLHVVVRAEAKLTCKMDWVMLISTHETPQITHPALLAMSCCTLLASGQLRTTKSAYGIILDQPGKY